MRISERFLALDLPSSPSSLDADARTVEAVLATESPVLMPDWSRGGLVPEVLLMSGLAEVGKLPLLDAHDRHTTKSVLGSVDNIRAENDRLVGRLSFSAEAASEFAKVVEGHLDSVSIGYVVLKREYVPAGETRKINGREFEGPVNVVTSWALREVSIVPVPADEAAKMRQAEHHILDRSASIMNPSVNTDPAVLAERERVSALHSLERTHSLPAGQAAKWVAAGITIEAARAATLEYVAQHRAAVVQSGAAPFVAGSRIEYGPEQRDKYLGAIRAGLFAKVLGPSFERMVPASERAAGFETFRGASLLDFARESLAAEGVETRGLSRAEIAQIAMGASLGGVGTRAGVVHTGGTFPGLLLDAANKTLLQGYAEYPSTWRMCFRQAASVPDLKTIRRVRMGEVGNLTHWINGADPDEFEMTDESASYNVEAFSNETSFSWHSLMNDDLDAFSRVPLQLGAAANRTVNGMVWGLLASNPTMDDGQALFVSALAGNRKSGINLLTGAGAPSVTTLQSLAKLIRVQRGTNTPAGNQSDVVLGLQPRYIIGPAALETTILQLVNSIADPAAGGNAGVFNPGRAYTPVIEPALDAYSATAWYLAVDPLQIDTVEVTFLEGYDVPRIRSWRNDRDLALHYNVLIAFGVKIVNHRGLAKHAGA